MTSEIAPRPLPRRKAMGQSLLGRTHGTMTIEQWELFEQIIARFVLIENDGHRQERKDRQRRRSRA